MVKSEISKLMTVLAAAYPRFEVNEVKLILWHELLQDIPYELCQLGVKKYIQENSFPPVIADIRKLVSFLILSMDNPLDGEEAWNKVLTAIDRYSIYNSTDAIRSFSTAIGKAVNEIGWAEICLFGQDNKIKERFIRIYSLELDALLKQCLVPKEIYKSIYELSHKI